MSFAKFLLTEAESKRAVNYFVDLQKKIEKIIEDINKMKEKKEVVESGNVNLIAGMNKVGASLGVVCIDINDLVQTVIPLKVEKEEKPNKKKMEKYLTK
jgi:hypothetical protein